MFGKLMSISDDLMWRYYLLLTDRTTTEIDTLRARVGAGALHPKQAKIDLAVEIVSGFHSAEARPAPPPRRSPRGSSGASSRPTTFPQVGRRRGGRRRSACAKLVAEAGLAASTSEASRKIQQGGVKVDRERITDIKHRIAVSSGSTRARSRPACRARAAEAASETRTPATDHVGGATGR